jgi:NADPH:quinone reductase-like Zn-dependent oxidoreductase
MRIAVARETGSIDNIRIEEVPAPGPIGPGQIRIAMRAASVNYRDLLWTQGTFGPAGPDGLIPCCDGAGEVVEVAPDVTRVKPGDRVALTVNPDWIGGRFQMTASAGGRGSLAVPGTMQDEIVTHESQAVLLPDHLSFEEGASLPCAGVTAWHALCGPAVLLPGMTVLTQGAGGVSLFALQFAKLFGARVIITSSSPERCARLKAMGADDVIDYKANPDWDQAVRDLTGGLGVDLTLDIGGAETIDRSLSATRLGGRVALIGLISGWPNSANRLFSSACDITPIKVGSRQDHEDMHRAIGFHRLRPQISATYGFAQIAEALHALARGQHFGKIVLKFD